MGELLKITFISGVIQEIQANQQLVITIASAEALLFILVIFFLFGRNKHKKKSFYEEFTGFMEDGDADLSSRMINLDSRMDLLVDKVKSVLTQLANIEDQLRKITDSNANIRSAEPNVYTSSAEPKRSQSEVLKIYDNIYRAYDSGVQVNDLSRKFGRSSGEIELILNIRKEQLR